MYTKKAELGLRFAEFANFRVHASGLPEHLALTLRRLQRFQEGDEIVDLIG